MYNVTLKFNILLFLDETSRFYFIFICLHLNKSHIVSDSLKINYKVLVLYFTYTLGAP